MNTWWISAKMLYHATCGARVSACYGNAGHEDVCEDQCARDGNCVNLSGNDAGNECGYHKPWAP